MSDTHLPFKMQLVVIVMIPLIMPAVIGAMTYFRQSYKRTKNSNYLRPFFNSVFLIDNKMEILHKLCYDNKEQRVMCDSIKKLIVRKYALLNQLLLLDDEEKITSELNRISKKILYSKVLAILDKK